MSGVTIIGALLEADGPVTAAVGTIKAGRLPDNVVLPALLVRSTSQVERIHLRRTGEVRITERVSVAVRADNYRDVGVIIKAIRTACAGKIGTIAGFSAVSVLSAGVGPDIIGPADTYERTHDFMVGFNEPA